ncbi:MAG: hydrogenobyrinic acid a,c-diamide synthase (glutamine-hydrolyzing) [Aigarchaeota archaeon]|nr:hydrogenobyrinic acid a,c-diamide synthase (glutamine-hydrolyzing) [Aigarchaeota archaeon]MDW7986023.1 cobyrinate a,c-diamide synthase [Nitrososphaerota archaeon]
MKAKRIIISSVSGKTGKTIITTAIVKKLVELGYRVQSFKIGPDFIDPSYHNLFSSRPSRNLDSIMMKKDVLLSSFTRAMRDADIGVIEGVFGLYDSIDGVSEEGSTAQVSKILKAPVILIINAERINRGVLALIKGFREFDEEVLLKGIIINNIGSENQKRKLLKTIYENFKDLEIVGAVFRSDLVEEKMIYRHLGLIPVVERSREISEIREAVNQVAEQIDIEKIISLASEVDELPEPTEDMTSYHFKTKVGILKDSIFSFYYPENLEYLQKFADRTYYINSMVDEALPDIDLLYIGGGFPEVYASLLEKNNPLKNEIRRKVEKGLKIYAECGGLMYLSNKIKTLNGEEYDMIGLIDGITEMSKRPVGHGYVYLKALRDNPLIGVNEYLVGHEFHYSRLILREKVDFAFKVERGYGIDGVHDGLLKENILTMYTHLHVLHNKNMFLKILKWAERD